MTKKSDLLEQANKLGLEITGKNTIAEIEVAIQKAGETVESEEPKTAKAGKRSEKYIKEAEVKAEKEARKIKGDTSPQSEEALKNTIKKGPKPITRSKLERRSKKYKKVAEIFDKLKIYSLDEAIELATKTNPSKFDASIEIHCRLGVDPRQADQNIRATVVLPNGSGKTVRVAVFAPENDHDSARKAGADVIGDEDFLKQLNKEELNFDILIATPQYMPKLGKYARLLGPRGLMPNPKSGSVATNIAKAVTEAKSGKVEYRVDKQAIVHLSVGKVSFGSKKLLENATAFFDSLRNQKPSSIKGIFVKSISISTTQGPGIKVDTSIC